MFEKNHFKNFAPLDGSVPLYPFPLLDDIATRARQILHNRTNEQVIRASKIIEEIIEQHREIECDEERKRDVELQEKLGSEYDEDLKDATDDYISFIKIWSKPYVYKCCFNDNFNSFFEPFMPEHRGEEQWAILALQLVGETIQTLNSQDENSFIKATDYALNAMDAVCYAEHIGDVEFNKKYQHIERNTINNKKALVLNDRRHEHNRNAKKFVLDEFDKVYFKYQSCEEAGNDLYKWLDEQKKGYAYEPSTIAGWLREHMAQKAMNFPKKTSK